MPLFNCQTPDYITEVVLPDTVNSIGDLCFYGCRELRSVTLYASSADLRQGSDDTGRRSDKQSVPATESGYSHDISIGSDVFMNCRNLAWIILCLGVKEKTAIRRILMQRNSATYVRFEDAAAYFPEFSEHYDLVGPAHIFELAIDGHGLRARQCFENGFFIPEAYDSMFEQAAVSEDEKTLCRMAASRLQFPKQLSESARRMYEAYLGEHDETFFEDAVSGRDLKLVLSLKKQGVLTSEQIKKCLILTTGSRWVEGTRMLLA
ncbi:MAG: leucine-rich repeat protein [Eubacterium sp.]|nr:leucine-rich repeat protein [Eubacterium sp.]